jgi:hypothetical protein
MPGSVSNRSWSISRRVSPGLVSIQFAWHVCGSGTLRFKTRQSAQEREVEIIITSQSSMRGNWYARCLTRDVPNAVTAKPNSSACGKWREVLIRLFSRQVQFDGPVRTQPLLVGVFLAIVSLSLSLVSRAEESLVPSALLGFEESSTHGGFPSVNRFALGVTLKLPVSVDDGERAGKLSGFGHWGLSYYSRYLERPLRQSFKIPFLHRRGQPDSGAISLGKLAAGYGQMFAEDSVLARNRNGTVLEEPSFLFLKATFRF